MSEKVLSGSDLTELLGSYSVKYAACWYDIGIELGIESHSLDEMEINNHYQCRRFFIAMVQFWLDNSKKPCTESDFKQVCENVKEKHDRLRGPTTVTSTELGPTVSGSETDSSPWAWLWRLPEGVRLVILACVVVLFGIGISNLISYVTIWQQPVDGPIENAAEVLRSNYRSLKITRFSGIGGIHKTSVNYLETVLKDKNGRLFEYTELLKTFKGESGKRAIITGLPGSGKTTLLEHLAREWANGTVLQSCKIVFLVDLNRIREEIDSISELLTKSMFVSDLTDLKLIANDITKSKGEGACFLLDDYVAPRLDYVNRIMEGSIVHSSFCLLSSRTDVTELDELPRYEIIGYDIEKLPTYLDNLTSNAYVTRKITRMWDSDETLKELCTSPLLMGMIVFVIEHDTKWLIETTTHVYIAFVNVIIQHYKAKNLRSWPTGYLWQCIRSNSNLGAEDDSLCTAFKVLCNISYETHFKYKTDFPSESYAVEKSIENLGFVTVNPNPVYLTESLVEYKFFHKTLIEFFAALYITTLPLNKQLLYVSQNSRRCSLKGNPVANTWFPISKVYLFYIGLLGVVYQDNPSNAAPFLKQMTLVPYSKTRLIFEYRSLSAVNVCSVMVCFESLEEVFSEIKWSQDSFHKAISSALVVDSALCLYSYDDHKELDDDRLQPYLDIDWKTYVIHRLDSSYPFKGTMVISEYHIISGFVLATVMAWTKLDTLQVVELLQILFSNSERDSKYDDLTNDLKYLYIEHYDYEDNIDKLDTALKKYSKQLKDLLHAVVHQMSIDVSFRYFGTYCSQEYKDFLLELNHFSTYSPHSVALNLVYTFEKVDTKQCHGKEIQSLCESVQRLSFHVYGTDAKEFDTKSPVECLSEARNLLELDVTFHFNSGIRYYGNIMIKLFENLPQNLQSLTIRHLKSTNGYFTIYKEEVEALSNQLKSLNDLSTIILYFVEILEKEVEVLINALSNLHLWTLGLHIAVSDNPNHVNLTSLSKFDNLKHLKLVLSGEKNNVIEQVAVPLIKSLKDFPKLKTFELTLYVVKHGEIPYTRADEELLSRAFDATHLEDIRIKMRHVVIDQFDRVQYSGTLLD